jgi:hypothetical protein
MSSAVSIASEVLSRRKSGRDENGNNGTKAHNEQSSRKKERYDSPMLKEKMRMIRKIAFGYAALFLGVYSLDYVPGVMDANGKMFGLFGMTPLVDAGHLALGALALISGLISAKAARLYFWFLGIVYGLDVVIYAISHWGKISPTTNFLVNLPHTVIFISAFIIAAKVDRT